jgi:hypothetical protein
LRPPGLGFTLDAAIAEPPGGVYYPSDDDLPSHVSYFT